MDVKMKFYVYDNFFFFAFPPKPAPGAQTSLTAFSSPTGKTVF